MVFPSSLVATSNQMPVLLKNGRRRGSRGPSVRPTAGLQVLLLPHIVSNQAAVQSFGQATIQDVLDVLDDEVYGHWRETESVRGVSQSQFDLFFHDLLSLKKSLQTQRKAQLAMCLQPPAKNWCSVRPHHISQHLAVGVWPLMCSSIAEVCALCDITNERYFSTYCERWSHWRK